LRCFLPRERVVPERSTVQFRKDRVKRNMKKFKLILCLCACVFGLTACGAEANENTLAEETKQELITNVESFIVTFDVDTYEKLEQELTDNNVDEEQSAIFLKGLSSWTNAKADIGNFLTDEERIVIANASNISTEEEYNNYIAVCNRLNEKFINPVAEYDDQGTGIIVKVTVQGDLRTAEVEAIFNNDRNHSPKSITTNVNYTFGEKMGKAGLNTLMGMGTVFAVLILISLIISLFKYISKIQDAFTKKDKTEAVVTTDPAIAQIIEKEELTDDLELIAVITAAIAASGTSGSADDFVVRSIRRKSNSQWNKA